MLSRQKFGFHFLTSSTWDPISGNFGALPFVYGTLLTSFLSLLIAVPVGIGAAIFLSELAPRGISNALTFLVELLAGGSQRDLRPDRHLRPGADAECRGSADRFEAELPADLPGHVLRGQLPDAGLVLSIMIVPFIVSISREVLMSVPTAQREAMMALGATKWEVNMGSRCTVRAPRHHRSIFLALARALGETMAVTMVIGNVPRSMPRYSRLGIRLRPSSRMSSPRLRKICTFMPSSRWRWCCCRHH